MGLVATDTSYDRVYTLYAWRDNNLRLSLTQGEGASLSNDETVRVRNIKAPHFKLQDERGTINLTSCTVYLALKRPDGSEDLLNCVIEGGDFTKGLISCPITLSATEITGLATGEIRVLSGGGMLKFYGVNFYIHKGVSDEAIRQSSQFSALETALNSIDDVADKATLVQQLVDQIADLRDTTKLINDVNASYKVFTTETGIDSALEKGSYYISRSSLTDYQTALGVTLSSYYWSALVIYPNDLSTGVTQLLIGTPTSGVGLNQIMFQRFCQTPSGGSRQFSAFVKLPSRSEITALQQLTDRSYKYSVSGIDIDNARTAGSYFINRSSLENYSSELGVTLSSYYWSALVIYPSDAGAGITQFLIGTPTSGTAAEQIIFKRFGQQASAQSSWSFSAFAEMPTGTNVYTYGGIYNTYQIDNCIKAGSYRVDRSSLTPYLSQLDPAINRGYWTVFVIEPSTGATGDVIQILFGSDWAAGTVYRFIRNRVNGTFGSFINLNSTVSPTTYNPIAHVMFIGDSFTARTSDTPKSYVDFLIESGHCTGTNFGEAGYTAGQWYNAHKDDITADYNTYFIALGLNNSTATADIGSPEDTSMDTYCGQMNAIINKIYEVNPAGRIIIWCMDAWFDQYMSEQAELVADYNGCEFYAMKANPLIPLRILGKYRGTMTHLTYDKELARTNATRVGEQNGTINNHPNINGQRLLANYLKHII